MHIKASGCFNSCGQHHVADLGFLGVSRNVGGRKVPHFQVVLGGQWTENAAAYGLAIGAVPSKRVPEVVRRITERFVRERQEGESFQAFVRRIGKANIRAGLQDLTTVPSYAEDPSYYSDWRDPREYSLGDMGTGECAGEIVPYVYFGLNASEREVFEAQLRLEANEIGEAQQRAYGAMLNAAKALVRHLGQQVADDDAAEIVAQFRLHLHETGLFHDPYAGGKFASYLFRAHAHSGETASRESAHQTIEEAQLFIEAAHACCDRMVAAASTPSAAE